MKIKFKIISLDFQIGPFTHWWSLPSVDAAWQAFDGSGQGLTWKRFWNWHLRVKQSWGSMKHLQVEFRPRSFLCRTPSKSKTSNVSPRRASSDSFVVVPGRSAKVSIEMSSYRGSRVHKRVDDVNQCLEWLKEWPSESLKFSFLNGERHPPKEPPLLAELAASCLRSFFCAVLFSHRAFSRAAFYELLCHTLSLCNFTSGPPFLQATSSLNYTFFRLFHPWNTFLWATYSLSYPSSYLTEHICGSNLLWVPHSFLATPSKSMSQLSPELLLAWGALFAATSLSQNFPYAIFLWANYLWATS